MATTPLVLPPSFRCGNYLLLLVISTPKPDPLSRYERAPGCWRDLTGRGWGVTPDTKGAGAEERLPASSWFESERSCSNLFGHSLALRALLQFLECEDR
jgi:hypothetical protein